MKRPHYRLLATLLPVLSFPLITHGQTSPQSAGQDGAAPLSSPAAASNPHRDYVNHRMEARRFIKQNDLVSATQQARAALDAARLGGNTFEESDATILLTVELHGRQRYSEARQVLEEQAARIRQTPGYRDQIAMLLRRATDEAMAGNDMAALARLQKQIVEDGHAWPPMWSLDEERQVLHYHTAHLSLPLRVGAWKLVQFEPAMERHGMTRLEYTMGEHGVILANASIMLSYSESQREQDDASRRAQLEKRIMAFDDAKAPHTASPLSALPFDGLIAVSRVKQPEDPQGYRRAQWLAMRDDWYVNIHSDYEAKDEQRVLPQLNTLFAALQWPDAPRLYRQTSMEQRNREIESTGLQGPNWSAAASLAQQALPDAVFPDEIVRINTLIALQAYQRDDLADAQRYFETAFNASEYSDRQDSLYPIMLDHAADVAWRLGRTREALALSQRLIQRSENMPPEWELAQGSDRLTNARLGLSLPLRQGDFHLVPVANESFRYEDLRTGAHLKLRIMQNTRQSDEKLNRIIRNPLEQDQGFRVLNMRKETFQPANAGGESGDLRGRKWIYDLVRAIPDEHEEQGSQQTLRLVYWIVDRGTNRILMNAAGEDEASVGSLVSQLAW
ncbi:hypothetical protein FJU30_20945 [Affinibrenneria salicis]|uniref:Tetratricopeptide repeat protein n=1 Tax=Affinibrenneria salicis TaxID=2590031 RepID=A0A5J5FTL6_9GAMM|nr:hypothetical protein [Affinibrenneria salicis]KAA8996675.1 hypothetical protein FJU30_20945 [Affinibrenneria salicis]